MSHWPSCEQPHTSPEQEEIRRLRRQVRTLQRITTQLELQNRALERRVKELKAGRGREG